ncbi:MAG: hypothetical protein R3B47_05840 [Bacteroidia bacterium]
MKIRTFIPVFLFSVMIAACGGKNATGEQAANAPHDPGATDSLYVTDSNGNAIATADQSPSVEGMENVKAEYDKGIASVIPGYLAISWFDLSDVEFEDRFYEEVKSYLLFPKFGDRVKKLGGKPITLAGYTITADADSGIYVLSANPLASCFFCGAAGPESVVQLNLKEGQREFQTDEWVTFKGKLRLNDSNINELNYILEGAEEVKKN